MQIEKQYSVKELEQREALRSDVQMYLYQFTNHLSAEQINHAIRVIISNDKRLFEIVIENFKTIENVLNDCENYLAPSDSETN